MRYRPTSILSLALVVAACSGGTGSATTTSASETTTTTVETTTTTEDPTTTSHETAAGIDECVVGSWMLDSEAFVHNFDSILAEAGFTDAEVTALDGSYTIELAADGSFTGIRASWGFSVQLGDGNFTAEISGFELGTWSAGGSTMTVDLDSSDLDVRTTVESGGQEVELPQSQFPFKTPEGIASNSEYACSDGLLTLTNAGVETILTRP